MFLKAGHLLIGISIQGSFLEFKGIYCSRWDPPAPRAEVRLEKTTMTNTLQFKGPSQRAAGSTRIPCAPARSLNLKVTLSQCSTISPLAPIRLTRTGYICLPIQFISGKKERGKIGEGEKQARSGTYVWATYLVWVTATQTQIPKAAPETASFCSIHN